MSVSFLLASDNAGYNTNWDSLVSSSNGLLKLSRSGSGTTSHAASSLAVASTTSTANDYVAGNVHLAGIAAITFATGDLIIGDSGTDGSVIKLPIGSNAQVLMSNGTTASWVTAPNSGTVTSVGITGSDLTITSSPITSSGTIDLSLNTVGLSKGGTGQTTQGPAFNAIAATTTTGDMMSNTSRLAIGANGSSLVQGASLITWTTAHPNIQTSGTAKTAGQATVTAGTSSVVISTTRAASSATIICTLGAYTNSADILPIGINTLSNGVSFSPGTPSNVAADITINWMIL